MAENNKFAHLSLPLIRKGKPKLHGYGKNSAQTENNLSNRIGHAKYLKQRSNELSRFWKQRHVLSEIKIGIPILLQIDPVTPDISFLLGMGFDIVCEIDQGFIIVATKEIDLTTFNKKIDEFVQNSTRRYNAPARIYALCEDNDRLKQILSKELYDKWNILSPDEEYTIDIGISCCGNIKMPMPPKQDKNETDEHYSVRCKKWEKNKEKAYMEWDQEKMEREEEVDRFIQSYHGEIKQIIDGSGSDVEGYYLQDSFSVRIKVTGKCLRDLVLNYPYLFEVSEAETIVMEQSSENNSSLHSEINIQKPEQSDPIVCVIDSGIQEGHRYLSPAIVNEDSQSFIPDDSSVNDEVSDGGHGTRVAGAVLYPRTIPLNGEYRLPCWIRNMRILNKENSLSKDIYPPQIIESAVKKYNVESKIPTKIFNHSIGESKPCEMKHMSAWAAEIDRQSYQHDVLFVQAAGNIPTSIISSYWQAGYPYPKYLDRELCRISDPAQSLQALTVGSVSENEWKTKDVISLGRRNEVSSFSRSGPGIWDVVKPEVVEYGGTQAYVKASNPPEFITPPNVCPELIRTSPEGPAFSQDTIGTSFSTPKVTYIASQIEKVFPQAPALLYRALIVQSARWNQNLGDLSKEECVSTLRHIGYGFPDVERATHNNEYRITLITPSVMELGEGETHIFEIPIPEAISNVGENFDIMIEVTLSYAANPRRTRRNIKGYLSTWLDWCSSRIGEKKDIFAQRIFEEGSSIEDEGDFKWALGDATNHGVATGYSRKNGTLQKDWCIVKSNQLSDAFCIAVRGHKGWSSLFKAKYSLVVSFEAINKDIPIYELIRTEVESEIENKEIEIEMSEG